MPSQRTSPSTTPPSSVGYTAHEAASAAHSGASILPWPADQASTHYAQSTPPASTSTSTSTQASTANPDVYTSRDAAADAAAGACFVAWPSEEEYTTNYDGVGTVGGNYAGDNYGAGDRGGDDGWYSHTDGRSGGHSYSHGDCYTTQGYNGYGYSNGFSSGSGTGSTSAKEKKKKSKTSSSSSGYVNRSGSGGHKVKKGISRAK